MSPFELSKYIKSEALRLGFDVCGIAQAQEIPYTEEEKMRSWIEKGMHGEMGYLERNCDKRRDPQALMAGCKSIISVAISYAQDDMREDRLHISRYARGEDYHKIIKDKLYLLLESIKAVADVKGRPFCDSAPIMERFWATQAGLGWIGRNHQLIIPHIGSYIFLGELLIDCELHYDKPFTENHCGNCKRCIENCPTNALTIDCFDARKCLSYLTIEYSGELPENIGEKMGKCIYGCDRCQQHCPWNKQAKPCTVKELQTKKALLEISDKEWKTMDRALYDSLFSGSAVERAGYAQLLRNISAIEEEK